MLNIPEEKLPKEFQDEDRLDSLYSPFRSRSVNPRDFDTKIESWKHLIYLYCVNNHVYSFSLSHLNKLLIRHGRPPSCLATVLEELLKRGHLQYLEDYLKENPKGWGSWATELLVKRPWSWSYNTVKQSLFSNKVDEKRVYVHVDVIRGEAQKILMSIPGKSRNKVMNFVEFMNLIRYEFGQDDDVKLLLHYLVQEKKADMTYLSDGPDLKSLLVKIGSQEKTVHISDADLTIYVLEQNEKLFIKQVEELEEEIAACIKNVKCHLLKGHRQLAKTCLKKKHEIEKRLTKKANELHNLQVLSERVKDVQTDASVWQSYKQALATFNNTLKQTGLNEDSVEETMLKLGEMLDIHDDIQTSISTLVSVEDEDLEQELADLMKSEQKTDTSTADEDLEQLANLQINTDLPNVPSTNVSLQEVS